MYRHIQYFLVISWLFVAINTSAQTKGYEVTNSVVSFHSKATNELIHALSEGLIGYVSAKNTFLFQIDIVTFTGFNSQLQKEHFNENYMESSIFPHASFAGKIIEDVNLSVDGEYNVRAKGKLTIHGIKQEKIINVKVTSKGGQLNVKANFTILLADFDIKVPRLVSDKLSEEIDISVDCIMTIKS